MITFPCRKKKCRSKHVQQWLILFADYYNKEIISWVNSAINTYIHVFNYGKTMTSEDNKNTFSIDLSYVTEEDVSNIKNQALRDALLKIIRAKGEKKAGAGMRGYDKFVKI